ncbi:MAG TPA: hypothetical protein VHW09_09005 [Bryobacteraceae bacterium]|jgi:hypothetical protein|nr:hypothetical protein [Bryobacteraceae bacterium]
MAEIVKFAFVLTENLERKSFKVPQAIVEINVNGAVDPLTHQKARDAVSDLFVKTQKSVNDDIQQRDLRITRMGVNEKKLKKRGEIDNGNKKIQELLATFKKEAQERLVVFKKKEEERELKAAEAERRENWKGVSFSINALWTGIKFFLDVGEAVTAPETLPIVVNQFVSNLMEIKGLVEEYGKVYADCPGMRKKVKDGLTSLKSKAKLTKSDVEQFGKDVDLFEDKLLVLETKSKAMSSKVTALMATVPKKGTVKPDAIEKAEKALHTCLEGLVEASTEINKASKYLLTLRKNLGVARAGAKNDPTYATVSSWAIAAYKTVNDFKDFLMKPDEWVTQVDGVIKFFSFAGNWAVGAN